MLGCILMEKCNCSINHKMYTVKICFCRTFKKIQINKSANLIVIVFKNNFDI